MPVLEFPAMFVRPEVGCPIGARIRFGNSKVHRVVLKGRARRTRLDLSLLTTSGPREATLAAMTLYGATLDAGHRLRRRELVAMRLPSGRRVKARVAWRLGKRCGVTFLSPVADFAQLLRECHAVHGTRRLRRASLTPQEAKIAERDWVRPLRSALTKGQRMSRQLLRWCRTL